MTTRAKLNDFGPSPAPPRRSTDATIPELEASLRIDTFDLTSAAADQPELFYRVAKRLAQLKAEQDAMKLHLDEVEALAEVEIRDSIDAGAKPTVGQIAAMVKLRPDVQAAAHRVQVLSQSVGEVDALRAAYAQRKSSLSDLVELQRQAGQQMDPAEIKRDVAEQRRNHNHHKGRYTHGE